jgi:hypothetical protein
MKADGGTLLYILIGLISVIISAVEKNRKKKAAANRIPANPSVPAPEPHTSSRPEWQKELEDIFGKPFEDSRTEADNKRQEEPVMPRAEPVLIPAPEKVRRPREHWERATSPVLSTEIISPVVKPEAQKSTEEDDQLITVDSEYFDLRKAVIYNEVLNRKYF